MYKLMTAALLCLLGSAATADQTMTDLKIAAQQIDAQLSLSRDLSGALHSYGHSSNVVESGVADVALISSKMVDDYNGAINNVLNASYLNAQDIMLEQHNTAIGNLHTAIDNLTAATAVLATVSTVADMAESANTTQDQLQVQQALATTDMTITASEVSDYNTALTDVNTYATQAGAFLAAANNTQLTSAVDSFAATSNVAVAAYTAVSYQQNIDQMIITWDANTYMSFSGYNSGNTVTADEIYTNVNYGG